MSLSLSNINNCINPLRIINPYTREVLYVPCRSCSGCRNSYGLKWTLRVEKESKFHRYVMFVTLTYDNDHLPVYYPIFKDGLKYWLSSQDVREINNIDFDITRSFTQFTDNSDNSYFAISDALFTNSYYKIPQGINKHCVACVSRIDCKKFIKRLRSNISYYFKKNHINEDQRIRYFLCSAYGPSTLRPHYHAIFWFDSSSLCGVFSKLLSSSWKNGFTDCSLVNSSAPQYVAKYVSGNTSLPGLYKSKPFRTFHLSSKSPIIGYSSDDEKAFFEDVFKGTYGHREYCITSKSFVHVQPPRSFENRYFPKCRGYIQDTDSKKLGVYSAAYNYFKRKKSLKGLSKYLHSYFLDNLTDIHCSLSCLRWCLRFHDTPEIYFLRLQGYYSKKELYLLKKRFDYQNDYITSGYPRSHLLDFDLTIYERLPRTRYGYLNSYLLSSLSSYGVDPSLIYDSNGFIIPSEVIKLKQCSSDFWKHNVDLSIKIENDSNKYKTFNDKINIFNY